MRWPGVLAGAQAQKSSPATSVSSQMLREGRRRRYNPSLVAAWFGVHATVACNHMAVCLQLTGASSFTNPTCLQVHSAVLAGSRKEVVVKVLRPGTEDVLLTDLNFVSVQRKQRAWRAQAAPP